MWRGRDDAKLRDPSSWLRTLKWWEKIPAIRFGVWENIDLPSFTGEGFEGEAFFSGGRWVPVPLPSGDDCKQRGKVEVGNGPESTASFKTRPMKVGDESYMLAARTKLPQKGYMWSDPLTVSTWNILNTEWTIPIQSSPHPPFQFNIFVVPNMNTSVQNETIPEQECVD